MNERFQVGDRVRLGRYYREPGGDGPGVVVAVDHAHDDYAPRGPDDCVVYWQSEDTRVHRARAHALELDYEAQRCEDGDGANGHAIAATPT